MKALTEQTLEVCPVKLETKSFNLRILALYRASSADFNQFMKRLDDTLKYLNNPKSEFLICGDINVDFATRTQNGSSTVINNIFVDITRLSSFSIFPITNGLSDHDDQFLTINNTVPATNIVSLEQRTREINNETIMQFQLQLTNETWESVYIDNDTNDKFNSFLCTFFNNFEANFPVKYKSTHRNKNGWITQGIKISWGGKWRLYPVEIVMMQ
jgi:hypothetical protein